MTGWLRTRRARRRSLFDLHVEVDGVPIVSVPVGIAPAVAITRDALALSDGSLVMLNAGSLVTVRAVRRGK